MAGTEANSDQSDMEMSPLPTFQKSNSSVQFPPFPTLIGEHVFLLSKTIDGTAMVTNFRFCVCERRSFINIPLMTVGELTVIEATRWLRIGCKDGSTYSCTFATAEDCRVCTGMLRERVLPKRLEDLFAFSFFTMASQKQNSGVNLTPSEQDQIALCAPVNESFAYTFGKEVERLGFDTNRRRLWRMSQANENYEYCPTYPKLHILPATVDDGKLRQSLEFRALKRFPSVVWRDSSSGVVLIRSSQPLSSFLGVSYYSNRDDVSLLEEIVNTCKKEREVLEEIEGGRREPIEMTSCQAKGQGDGTVGVNGEEGSVAVGDNTALQYGHGASASTKDNTPICKLAIVDCRSLAGVWGNSFKGGGTEDEAVYKCTIINLDLANIHTIRDSFNKLRNLCHSYPEGTYYKTLSSSMWLVYISALLRGANIVVELMKVKKRPVLVHCSDGWDRTSQICSLSELLMDPYYRTIQGFQVLVEREWLHFGHKFAERGGHDPKCSDYNQISPIFLQFLDCVYQLTLQYPAEFEFNETYLIKLLKHSQACLFGNFLHNCQREREECKLKTASVWSLLQPGDIRFNNLLYKPKLEVLIARFSEHDVSLWQSVYMEGHSNQSDFYLDSLLPGEDGAKDGNQAAEGIHRSRSMEDLSRSNPDSLRRNSDPNLAQGQESAAAAPTSGGGEIHDTSSSSTEILHLPEDSPPCGSGVTPAKTSTAGEDKETGGEASLSSSVNASPKKVPESAGVSSSPVSVVHPEGEDCGSPSQPENLSGSGEEGSSGDTGSNGTLEASASTQSLSEMQASSPGKLSPSTGSAGNNSISSGNNMTVAGGDGAVTDGSAAEVGSGNDNGLEMADHQEGDSAAGNLKTDRVQDKGNTSESLGSKDASDRDSGALNPQSKPNSKLENVQYSLLAERLANAEVSGDSIGVHKTRSDIHSNGSKPRSSATAAAQSSTSSGPSRIASSNSDSGRYSSIDEVQLIKHSSSSHATQTSSTNGHHKLPSTSQLYSPGSGEILCEDMGHYFVAGSPNSILQHKHLEVYTKGEKNICAGSPPLSSSSSSTISQQASPLKKEYSSEHSDPGSNLLSRRARAASGASRDLSISPSPGNWTDTGRLRHPSGNDSAARRLSCIRSTVSTSTTDISDSYVGQPQMPSVERGGSLKQHIDIDGLTLFGDQRQELLAQLVSAKDRKIFELEHRLVKLMDTLRKARCYMAGQQNQPSVGLEDLVTSDSEGGEPSSLGATSNPSLDSWENMDETEAKVMPWVPDHTVTHCAGCDGVFWIGRWKHHCRNCGKVFCDECTNYRAPVPHAHLNKPERVCRRCHSNLLQLSPGASSDGRIPTLVADG